MEKCYVCNSCGKCNDQVSGTLLFVCKDCGHIIESGESTKQCAECGGSNIGISDFSKGTSAQ